MLHLVRHGRSEMDPSRIAASWGLHAEAAPGVEALRVSGVLPEDGAWFSSGEPKAVQTAALLHADVHVLEDLHESDRPLEWFESTEEFTAVVSRSMQRDTEPARVGWETFAAVQTRVYDAVAGAVLQRVVEADVDEVVLVGHGTAWTGLVSTLTGTPADVAAWREMTMPDHCALRVRLDPDGDLGIVRPRSGHMVQPWGAWRTARRSHRA